MACVSIPAAAWIAAGTAAAGAGAEVYGATTSAKASAAANEANKTAVQQANDQNWTSYLLSRGITTGSVVPAGTLPESNAYQAVNTKLPLWASINTPNSMSGPGGSSTFGANGTSQLGAALTAGPAAPTVQGYQPRGVPAVPTNTTTAASTPNLRSALRV